MCTCCSKTGIDAVKAPIILINVVMLKIKTAINHLCLPTKRISNFYSINTKIPIPGFSKNQGSLRLTEKIEAV